MARTKSSARWLREHFTDEYVKRAQQEGYRSRAVYKLLEIHEKDRLLRPGMTVVDLGAAPGSWSQLAARLVGQQGIVIALDILPIEPLPGVECIEGDFRETVVLEQLLAALNGRSVDLVLADMAPNTSGIKAVDQPRGMYLSELALDFARRCLRPGGDFLLKIFQGEGFDVFLKELRPAFITVAPRKPKASRARSAEQYLLARNYRG
ncbi:MAG: 23S rRNA (uridine(2552)-2'-O)-methyltransferase RlmE [Candidatus Competibacteraceae bacterium]|nr:23S rRNA (uridine(2552)-2'-O)-methyltransferase RlmE [Candidatus Contendobacter odensis]MBK8537462.1 23S rRNA (uridine(2552)-2'-O)-methyltransferase RlmE [Candidatus Competibacteraceae bacterium]MBK8751556.1 23S rRNA (uridine(2552)-2'-O)-methyltransferase RlmE [Candidatus Competibacteraceae bacterium]